MGGIRRHLMKEEEQCGFTKDEETVGGIRRHLMKDEEQDLKKAVESLGLPGAKAVSSENMARRRKTLRYTYQKPPPPGCGIPNSQEFSTFQPS